MLYLSPADYHHVHAPASLAISERVHVPGRLLPVLEAYAAHVKGLFTLNERVVLAGDWPYGSFALGMVGAYNVGSIRVQGDSVRTNLPHELLYEGHVHRRVFEKPWEAAQGERVGTFALGSTVVLAFEAPQFTWLVQPGEKVRVGQPIGYVRRTRRVEEIVDTEYPALLERGRRENAEKEGEGSVQGSVEGTEMKEMEENQGNKATQETQETQETQATLETQETQEIGNGETGETGETVETGTIEIPEETKTEVESRGEESASAIVETGKGKELEKPAEFPTVLEVMISVAAPEGEKTEKNEDEEAWILVPEVKEKDSDLWYGCLLEIIIFELIFTNVQEE